MNTDDLLISTNLLWYGVIAVVGFVLLVILSVRIRRIMRRMRFGDQREMIEKQWKEVIELMKRGDGTSQRLAIIHADMVLDLALKSKGFPGKTTGERLSFATKKYRNLKQTFWARSLRNTLVHEAGVELRTSDANAAIAAFARALETLGAI